MKPSLQPEAGNGLSAARYQTLFRVSQAIGSHHDPKELFGVLANELRQVIQFDGIGVVQFDEVGNKLKWHLAEKCSESGSVSSTRVAPEDAMTWWVYQNQQPVVISSVNEETRFPRTMDGLRRYGIQSVCAFPLTTAHRRLGCLVIGSEHPDSYTGEEVSFLSLVANQVAVAMDDALHFEALQKAQAELESGNDRLKLILDVNNSVASNLELRELLRAVTTSVRRVMQCDAVAVELPDADGKRLRIYALDFPESKGFFQEETLISIEQSSPGKVFQTGKPLVLGPPDPAQINPEEYRRVIGEGLKSGCLLPLISRSRVLGVLGLGRRQENAFAQDDVDFLKQVATQIAIAVENALAYGEITELKDKLAQEKLYLEDEIRGEMDFEGIVGQSSALRNVLQLVETVAPSDSTVLLLGETGTGKELIARAIHDRSRRKERTFVRLNCAAIPTGLLESELFGHEKGAFTGAISQKIGRLELADDGTLFLDEVGDIPLEVQPKLLRALQEREFERLGSSRTQKVDVRLVAATNRDLDKMAANHEFRSDLYYRLNVFPIRIPPLRERPEDIPLLLRYFTQKYAQRMEKRIESIPAAAIKKLTRWDWPGNIRELQNFVERAVILTRGTLLQVPIHELKIGASTRPLQTSSDSPERGEVMRILRETKGRVGGPQGAAARMGIKRTTLISRMKKLGIDPRKVS